MKLAFGALFFCFTLLILGACSKISPRVSFLSPLTEPAAPPPPGFRVDGAEGALTGGGMTLKARLSPLGGSTLTGGGMTLSHGRVR